MPSCKQCQAPKAQLKINLNRFCDYECATSYGKDVSKKAQERARAKKEREAKQSQRQQRKSDRDRLAKLKTSRDWSSECQDVFNKMRRLEELIWFKERELEPTCISCQKPLGGDIWSCGHYKTRGARQDLAFDRKNTFLQHLMNCNKSKSGDIRGFQIGLAARFGDDFAREVIDYCEIVQPIPKRKAEDWIALKAEWNKEIRRLQKMLDS